MFFLIAIIYLAFISLGLPDSLMGAAWPAMHKALGVPISYMGIVSSVVIICTIISSLFSSEIIKRFGTGIVTAVSVLFSSIGLVGYSTTNSLPILCLWAIPYGLGAGAVDAALNNYVAINMKSRHMSWLHCFWGAGTIIGPYTNSKPTYRQILGYNNPILRQTPLTGGSLPAVVFLDLDYSICRLCL